MTGIRAVLIATVLCTAWTSSAMPQQEKDRWVPTLADVQELESHLTKPDPTHLAKSTRFYYGYFENGSRVIRGEILTEGIGRDMKIHILPSFPEIMDGGCGVINLSYDPVKRSVLSLRCNGRA
jgi:hypothetical protein